MNDRDAGQPATVVVVCVVLLLLSACTTASPARPASRLFDGTGKIVGDVVDADSALGPIVALGAAPGAALLRMRGDRLTAEGALNYESSDCSGTPFANSVSTTLMYNRSTRLASTAIGGPGRTVYVAVPFAKAHRMTLGSFLLNETCYVAPFEATVVPVRAVVDLAAAFSPPYTLGAPR